MFLIDDIIWLDAIVEKLAWKHNVFISEVEEVLSGKCRIFRKEKGLVEGEHLYNALGRTNGGRYLSVFFIMKLNNKALIVTARDMTKSERKRYDTK
ncbi:MAG: BrnT family toxin [Nitrospirae bacterium]|nr:MAG: BrnT family toxin [Nitrospirota bacterium]